MRYCLKQKGRDDLPWPFILLLEQSFLRFLQVLFPVLVRTLVACSKAVVLLVHPARAFLQVSLGALGCAVGFLRRNLAPLLWLMINACAVTSVLLLEAFFPTERVGHSTIEPAFSPAVILLFLLLFCRIGRSSFFALFFP